MIAGSRPKVQGLKAGLEPRPVSRLENLSHKA